MHRPDVQDMLRRLAAFHLGIFMPHMHDEHTGDFRPLPDDVTQVEAGLAVSFQPRVEIARRAERFLPIGWFWHSGAPTPVAVCEMIEQEGLGEAGRAGHHTGKDGRGRASAR